MEAPDDEGSVEGVDRIRAPVAAPPLRKLEGLMALNEMGVHVIPPAFVSGTIMHL